MNNKAVTVRENTAMAMPVDSIEGIEQVGEWFASSGMFGCKNAAAGKIMALTCYSEGITPIEMKRKYHMIDGNLSMRADYMLADFLGRKGKYKVVSRTPELAAITLEKDGNETSFEFSWEDAKQEPFTKDKNGKIKANYATPRARMQMLWARVVSDAIRVIDPGVVAGVYTPEEMGESDRPKGQMVDIDPKEIDLGGGEEKKEELKPEKPEGETKEPEKAEADEVIPPKTSGKPRPKKNPKKDTPLKEEKKDKPESPESVDYTLIPIGKKQGEKFEDLTLPQLQKFLEISKSGKYNEIKAGHQKVICALIEKHESSE